MSRYTVIAERSGKWWSLQCEEVPGAISQVARLNQAEQIREAIAFVAHVPEDSVEIDLQIKISDEARRHIELAHSLREQSLASNKRSAEEARIAARVLKDSGLTIRDVGIVMDVSFQRAHQLINS